ncbi:MAG: hypothetical protein P1U89_17145 [Verrucomicrobiales bacterium]|nr:hypothetical protein [Verrucomicrobiales bacterium]
MKLHQIIPIIVITSITHSVFADETGKDHAHESEHDSHHASILIPEDPADLWAHINAYSKAVSIAANENNIEALHKEQINLQALIDKLDHTLETLPEDKRTRVTGMINNAKRALDQLHVATDEKNTDAMKKSAKGLTGAILLMKSQYPKEITSGMAEVQDDIGPHEGILSPLKNAQGETVGFIELKLHDDKGDLELWLAKDRSITAPMDISMSTEILVTFASAARESATLKIRNSDKNEDEEGTPTLRDGKTNYFIFPGDSGTSAEWLMGAQFKSQVVVTFEADGSRYTTDSFLLVPHTHAEHGHAH